MAIESPGQAGWSGLFQVADAIVPSPGFSAVDFDHISGQLNKIIRLLEESVRLLRLIRRDTKALLEGPYKTAGLWLDLAQQSSIDRVDKKKYVADAAKLFMDSMGLNEHNPILYSVTALNAGACWLELDKKAEAVWCFRKGHSVAAAELEKRYNAYKTQDNGDVAMKSLGSGVLLGIASLAAGPLAPLAWVVAGGSAMATHAALSMKKNSAAVSSVLEAVEIVNGLQALAAKFDHQAMSLKRAKILSVGDFGITIELA